MSKKKEEINSYSQIAIKIMESELNRRRGLRRKCAVDFHEPVRFTAKYPDFFKEKEMKEYIGTKVIKARPATRLEFETSMINKRQTDSAQRGLENALAEGYMVEYQDGYVSWSPKEAFEEAYREIDGSMTFGQALEALKMGKKVARKGWNGKGMFLYVTPGSTVPKKRLRWETAKALEDLMGPTVTFGAHIDMKAADGTVVVGWLASQTDMLSEDWMIIE